jgi:hypothetical protein
MIKTSLFAHLGREAKLIKLGDALKTGLAHEDPAQRQQGQADL